MGNTTSASEAYSHDMFINMIDFMHGAQYDMDNATAANLTQTAREDPLFFHVISLTAILMVPVVLAIMNLYIIVALSLVCDVYMYIGTILDLLGQELVTPSLIYDIYVYTWTILDRLRQRLVTLLATSRPARDPVRQREHCLFDRVIDAVAKFSVFVLFNTVVVMIAYWMAVRRAPLSMPDLPEHCGFFQMMNDECIDLRRAFARLNARVQFGLLLLIRGLRLQNCPVLAVPIAAVQGYQRAFQTSWWRGMRHVGIQMWMANMVFFPLMYMMCWLAPKSVFETWDLLEELRVQAIDEKP